MSLTNNLPQEVRFFAGLQHAVNLAKRNAEESCALVASSWEFGCHKDGKQTKGIHECTEKSMNCMNIGIKRLVFDMNKSMNY